MKTTLRRMLMICIALSVCTLPAMAQIRSSRILRVNGSFKHLREVNFENFPLFPSVSLANPLIINGVTFSDPTTLDYGFCAAPTCIPAPDNPHGGDTELFLNAGGTISFATAPRRAVLDIQGMGDNPFVLLVTDTRGRTQRVRDAGVLYGQKLVGVFSNRGIASIEVISVGGTGGPLVVARVWFSKK